MIFSTTNGIEGREIAHLLAEPSEAPDGSWLAFESFMSGAHHGFTTETRRLWSPDGRLLVENHPRFLSQFR